MIQADLIDKIPIKKILNDYINIVIPALYKQKYHLLLAKGGVDYPHLSEQSFLGHTLNGIFGLIEIIKFIINKNIFVLGLDESMIRKALALHTVHDVHKFKDYQKMPNSEFAIPLKRLEEEYKKLNLIEFAGEIDFHMMREANVSKRSKHHGDMSISTEEHSNKLWVLVRIADTIASVTSAKEAVSALEGYLACLALEFKTKYKLYAHQLQDIRGVLTTQIHNATKKRLVDELGFQDIVYFATDTLYLGQKKISDFTREQFIYNLVNDILNGLNPEKEKIKSEAKEGLRLKKFDFENYVYIFADLECLLEIVKETTIKANAKDIGDDIQQIASKKNAPKEWDRNFEKRFSVSLQESQDFYERWSLVRRYFLYLDNLLKALTPELDRLIWFCNTYNVSQEIVSNLKADESLFSSGGLGKQVLIPAYFFLKGIYFLERSVETYDNSTLLEILHNHTIDAIKKINVNSGKQKISSAMGFVPELTMYLKEFLFFSFCPNLSLDEDSLKVYSVSKKKGHSSNVCSICNRRSKYIQPLRTGVLGDSGQDFSNRVLPAKTVPNDLRPWCPICHLEFIFRKLTGLSLPNGADYKKSRRIHLYVLPTYSFTPEYAKLIGRMLRPLKEITSLPVRDYGEKSGLPKLWLQKQELDLEYLDIVIDVLSREAERISKTPGYVGERLLISQNTLLHIDDDQNEAENEQEKNNIKPQPNYFLIPWEHSVREKEEAPTNTEAWAKATFAAVVISALTSSRVFVTEQPYLPISNPSELKAIITLDSPPSIIAKLLGNDVNLLSNKADYRLAERTNIISLYGREKGYKSGLERALDLCAALWMITSSVHRPNFSPKDKQIAERLGDVAVNPLAGAHFYKEYSRLNDDKSPFLVLLKACEVLLQYFGGELMQLVTNITEKSLKIRLPFRKSGRGKVHSYELVFRDAIDAVKSSFKLVPELRQVALTGQPPSSEAINELKLQSSGTLLKAMERRRTTRRGEGIINPYNQDLSQLVGDFIDLIIDEMFLKRSEHSFTHFLKLEDKLADGVYYCTDRLINQKWQEYRKTNPKNLDKSDELEIEEEDI
ncbi:MAG: type I-D CRISPR-associated protein Cas10d/Csc3 [Phormidium sp.]